MSNRVSIFLGLMMTVFFALGVLTTLVTPQIWMMVSPEFFAPVMPGFMFVATAVLALFGIQLVIQGILGIIEQRQQNRA